MAWTQTDLDAIKAAIAKGVKRVTYENKTVEYRSIDELKAARDEIQKELDQAAGKRRRQFRASSCKGW